MKTLYRISIFLNCIAMAFIIIRGSELFTQEWLKNAGQAQHEKTTEQSEKQTDISPQVSVKNRTEAEIESVQPLQALPSPEQVTQQAGSNPGDTTTCDTAYHVLVCDLTQGTEHEEIEDLPLSYIGKNRAQLMDLLDTYNESPPLEEQTKGFQGMELVAFSRTDITVRKTYETQLFYCCVVVEDDYLTVYDEKRENVILYTDIRLQDLPDQLAQEIIDGKYFKTEQDLYHFLESYSS